MNWKLIRIIDSCIGIFIIWCLHCASLGGRPRTATHFAPFKRILLVKFWGIGNLFMLLPTIRALRQTWPAVAIDFLTLECNREALAMTDAIDDIFTVETKSFGRFLRSWLGTTRALKKKQYDLIIDFEQFSRFSALMTHQIGALQTVGFATRGQHRHYLYTDSIVYDDDIHITRSFYALAGKVGVTLPFTPELRLAALNKVRDRGLRLLSDFKMPPHAPVVIMHIGTSENFRERRWAPERYGALADLLIGQYGMRIVLTGLPEEAYLSSMVGRHMKSSALVTDACGVLSFEDYFALIMTADLVISADTSAVHLASVMDIPVIGLYGPNSPHLYGPWGSNGLAIYAGLDCSPCITNFNSKINTCRHPDGRGACMRALTVEDVFEAIAGRYCLPQTSSRLQKLAVQP